MRKKDRQNMCVAEGKIDPLTVFIVCREYFTRSVYIPTTPIVPLYLKIFKIYCRPKLIAVDHILYKRDCIIRTVHNIHEYAFVKEIAAT